MTVLSLVPMSFYFPQRSGLAIWNDKNSEFFPPYALSVQLPKGGEIRRKDKLLVRLNALAVQTHYEEAKTMCERLEAAEATRTSEERKARQKIFTQLMKTVRAKLRCWQMLKNNTKPTAKTLIWYVGDVKRFARNEPPKPGPGQPPIPLQKPHEVVYTMEVLNRNKLQYPAFPLKLLLTASPYTLLLRPPQKARRRR